MKPRKSSKPRQSTKRSIRRMTHHKKRNQSKISKFKNSSPSYNYKSLQKMSKNEVVKENKKLNRWLEKVTNKSWDVNAADSIPISQLIKSYNQMKRKNFNGMN